MGVKLLVVFLIVCTVAVYCKDYYTAAVFEHRSRGEPDQVPRDRISANLQFYEKAAHLASNKGADIVVFNEYGIHPYDTRKVMIESFNEPIPDPEKVTFNPCVEGGQNMPILSTLSCMAKKNNLYLVANMAEVQPCEGSCNADKIEGCDAKCPEENVLLFNTNVVFDRKGTLIAKYHKNRPYVAENFNSPDPDEPEFITFSTNFGKFGLIICFDSVFESSKILAEEHGIDTMVFTTFWFDDVLPFNGVEWQQSWAMANKVNFLAANTQTAGTGSLGSGIYSKDHGALVYTYEPDGESKLLVANIPLTESKLSSNLKFNPSVTVIQDEDVYLKQETGDKFPLYGYIKVAGPVKKQDFDYRVFKHQTKKYALKKLETNEGNLNECNNGFCCRLQYETVDDLTEDFYLAVFSGLNDAENYFHWCEEVCMLVRCDSFEEKPCVLQPSQSKTAFKSLSIAADFTSERVYPTVTKTKFRLAPKNEWNISIQGSEVVLNFETLSKEPLLKVGLLGRCYKRDPPFVPWYQY